MHAPMRAHARAQARPRGYGRGREGVGAASERGAPRPPHLTKRAPAPSTSSFFCGGARGGAGLYNVDGFFDPLLAFFRHSVEEGFFPKGTLDGLVVAADAKELLDGLQAWVPTGPGLLSAEQRKAAIGTDVSGHAAV